MEKLIRIPSMTISASCLDTPDVEIEREYEKTKARNSVDPRRMIIASTNNFTGSEMSIQRSIKALTSRRKRHNVEIERSL